MDLSLALLLNAAFRHLLVVLPYLRLVSAQLRIAQRLLGFFLFLIGGRPVWLMGLERIPLLFFPRLFAWRGSLVDNAPFWFLSLTNLAPDHLKPVLCLPTTGVARFAPSNRALPGAPSHKYQVGLAKLVGVRPIHATGSPQPLVRPEKSLTYRQ